VARGTAGKLVAVGTVCICETVDATEVAIFESDITGVFVTREISKGRLQESNIKAPRTGIIHFFILTIPPKINKNLTFYTILKKGDPFLPFDFDLFI